MIVLPSSVRVLVATQPVDFRKGIDGLPALVQEHTSGSIPTLVRSASSAPSGPTASSC